MKKDWRKQKKRRKLAKGLGFDHYYNYKAEVRDQCIIYKYTGMLYKEVEKHRKEITVDEYTKWLFNIFQQWCEEKEKKRILSEIKKMIYDTCEEYIFDYNYK